MIGDSANGLPSGANGASGDDAENYRADMNLLTSEGDAAPEADEEETPENEEEPEGDEPEGEEEPEEDKEEEEEEEESKDDKKEEDKDKAKPEAAPRHSRPTVTEINKEYPGFFKKFPDMRHMLFREAEFSNLFPTVDDAKEANEQAQSFGHFSDLLAKGNPENIGEFLKGVHEAGPEMLESFAGSFLPALYGQNRDLYFQTTMPVAQSLLENAYKTGTASNNDSLKNAALHLAQWVFGDTKYATGEAKVQGPKVKSKDPELEKERETFYKERYTEAQSYVAQNASNRLRTEIRKGLDPNGVFNDFTSGLLVDKIMEELGRQLESDPKHMGTMNSLWKHARTAGFAGNFRDRLLSTYLSGARAVMPSIRARIRDAALKDQKQRAENRELKAEKSGNRREVRGATTTAPNLKGRTPPAREVDWGRTSDMDILNDRPTLKNGR